MASVRLVLSLPLLVFAAACSHGTDLAALPGVPDDAGAEAGVDGGRVLDGGGDAGADGGMLGKPCTGDADCDDAIPCTRDVCDPDAGRCRHTPDGSLCENGVFCDGVEVCDLHLGCRPGVPVSCSDGNSCTIDA